MSIGILFKCCDPMVHGRTQLAEQSAASIERAFPNAVKKIWFVAGATDGSFDWQRETAERFGFVAALAPAKPCPPGRAVLDGMEILLATWPGSYRTSRQGGIVVSSDDDMLWREGAEEKVESIWSDEHSLRIWGTKIVSGLLEPEWSWNTPREALDCGTERILVRDSAPGAAWTFRAEDWDPSPGRPGIREVVKPKFGYDFDACVAMKRWGKLGSTVAQADLAEHIGWGFSTHGNDANKAPDGRPLDREKWGI